MANLIRLKQIESGSALQTSAEIGTDFSQSVVNIITSEVQAVLPEGVISSSVQVNILQTANFVEFSSSISNSFVNVYTQLASITGSIETGLSASVATSFSQSNAIFTQFSSSLDARVDALESFSSSLDNGFATDAELTLSQSNINIDMGEW
jgi:hypothetical protein